MNDHGDIQDLWKLETKHSELIQDILKGEDELISIHKGSFKSNQ